MYYIQVNKKCSINGELYTTQLSVEYSILGYVGLGL